MLMLKVFNVFCFYSILLISPVYPDENEEVYDENSYEDDDLEYSETENMTEEKNSLGRDEQLIGDSHSVFPLNQYTSPGSQNFFQELLNYPKPSTYPGIKKRKVIGKKGYKYLIPLLLNMLAKVAHLLPVVKLTLLALFALVLFSKKALLVSIGSLILVIYDTFYKKKHTGVNTVKDRVSTVPTVEPDEPSNIEDSWWGREERRPPQLQSRDDDRNEKWKRWWAPQLNKRRNLRMPQVARTSDMANKKDYFLLHNLFFK